MEAQYKEQTRVMDLPILKHFDKAELITTGNNPLSSFRKGEKGMFNIFKLVALGALGYLSWVYILPPLFQALGQVIAIAGSIVLIVALVMMAPVILKGMRRMTRVAHKAIIKHDPFAELEEQKQKMLLNKTKFHKSKGNISKLRHDMEVEAKNSEENAKNMQRKILSAKATIERLKAEQEQLKKVPDGKTSDKYINNYAELIKQNASAQRLMYQLDQQKDFIRKYGSRAQTMQKLGNKLVIVGTQMEIKILDFDATIEILKKDYEFAQKSREATESAKDAMMFTEGWEVEYALDVVTSTIAEDIALTAANLNDIDSFTSMYSMDDDELYIKLDALAEDIETGKDEVPVAKQYSNPDYNMTHEDRMASGGFGSMF